MSGSKEPSNMSMSFVPSPLLICNLVPNEDGEVHVSASDLASYGLDLSVSGHGVVAAVAMTTGHGSASACACIEGACHPKDAPVVPTYPPRPFQPGSKCIEARRVAALKANEVLVVPDPGNLKLRVVDCLPKVGNEISILIFTSADRLLFRFGTTWGASLPRMARARMPQCGTSWTSSAVGLHSRNSKSSCVWRRTPATSSTSSWQ